MDIQNRAIVQFSSVKFAPLSVSLCLSDLMYSVSFSSSSFLGVTPSISRCIPSVPCLCSSLFSHLSASTPPSGVPRMPANDTIAPNTEDALVS